MLSLLFAIKPVIDVFFSGEKLKAKADAIVVELAKCQKAIGTGYLSAYPEEQIDRVI